jgi:uncharacterized protein (TIGR04552 family)
MERGLQGGARVSEIERLDLSASLAAHLNERPLDLADIEAVRLVLQGSSVIDWHRMHFKTRSQVDRFLGHHMLDWKDAEDRRRVNYVHGEAVNYLEEHLKLQFPTELREPEDVRDLLIIASETGGFRRRQIMACVILKLMHVINHMEAAELRFQTPLSEADLMDLAERRIVAAADRMRGEDFPLVAFYGSRKSRNSIITKLLSKKENTAATIFDKLRFRIVTEKQEHIIPAIAWLTRELFPFNYVIPGQSQNNLVDLAGHIEASAQESELGDLQALRTGPDNQAPEINPFSGGSYRMVNFIVDFPVRVDHLMNVRYGALLGRTVFVLVEFQVLDRETARANEEGENAHRLYKDRQRAIVGRRLKKGVRRKTKE